MEKCNYDWYWENYRKGMNWIKWHEVAYWKSQALAFKFENDKLLQMIHNSQIDKSSFQNHRPSQTKRNISKKRKNRSRRQVNETSEINEIAFDIEVSPELTEFFRISIQHKKDYKKEKEKLEAAFVPPQETVDLRKKEMIELYGEGSSQILGMETAIKLNYERFISQKNPEYWPNIPLNLAH